MVYLLLIALPLAFAAACFILRRQSNLVISAALGALLVQGSFALQIPVDAPARLVGITLNLSALGRLFLFAFILAGIFLLIAAYHAPHGESFVPVTLLTIGQVSLIVLLQDPFIVTLLLASTGLTAVLAIVDLPVGASTLVGARSIAAALKYLILMVVAGALMYVAFVLADIFRPGELPGRVSLARFVLALLAVAFALRLALVPFHTWLTDLFQYAEPLVAGMLVVMLNTASLLVLVLALQNFPTLLTDNGSRLAIMRIGALISALIAAVLAYGQPSLRRAVACLILFDCGMVFYGLTALSPLGLSAAVYGAINQVLAVTLICICLALLERPDGRAVLATTRNDLLRWQPIAATGLLVGCLSLLGLPPFSGFGGRLMLFQAAAEYSQWEALGLLVALGAAGAAIWWQARERLFGPSAAGSEAPPLIFGETELDRPQVRKALPEPRSTSLVTGGLVIVCLGLGIFPQPLLDLIDQTVRSLVFIRAL